MHIKKAKKCSISETIRKYPQNNLTRVAAESHTFTFKDRPDITIPKNTKIVIPVYALHRDPKFYPNPEVFDPERTQHEKLHPMAFLPFGADPRSCIGNLILNFLFYQVQVIILNCF